MPQLDADPPSDESPDETDPSAESSLNDGRSLDFGPRASYVVPSDWDGHTPLFTAMQGMSLGVPSPSSAATHPHTENNFRLASYGVDEPDRFVAEPATHLSSSDAPQHQPVEPTAAARRLEEEVCEHLLEMAREELNPVRPVIVHWPDGRKTVISKPGAFSE
jgi:hypothetical protein